jgi:SRSO17 transposase
MTPNQLQKFQGELSAFVAAVAGDFGRRGRARWGEAYLHGLLLDGDRKSIEPMADRLWVIDKKPEDYEQALQQFVSQSPWDERAVRDGLAKWVGEHLGTDGSFILDDTGFPKCGDDSVGVTPSAPDTNRSRPSGSWSSGRPGPTGRPSSSFAHLPADTSLRQLVQLAKSRYFVEHSYKELKEELGLDHFEGRSWRGWHHPVTLVLLAYAFLQHLRRRAGKKGAPNSRPCLSSVASCNAA